MSIMNFFCKRGKHEFERTNKTFINDESHYVIWKCKYCEEKRKTVFVKSKGVKK